MKVPWRDKLCPASPAKQIEFLQKSRGGTNCVSRVPFRQNKSMPSSTASNAALLTLRFSSVYSFYITSRYLGTKTIWITKPFDNILFLFITRVLFDKFLYFYSRIPCFIFKTSRLTHFTLLVKKLSTNFHHVEM